MPPDKEAGYVGLCRGEAEPAVVTADSPRQLIGVEVGVSTPASNSSSASTTSIRAPGSFRPAERPSCENPKTCSGASASHTSLIRKATPLRWPLPRHPDAQLSPAAIPRTSRARLRVRQGSGLAGLPSASSADRAFASRAFVGLVPALSPSLAPYVAYLDGQSPYPSAQRPIRIRGERQADLAGQLLGHLSDRPTVGRHVLGEGRILERA